MSNNGHNAMMPHLAKLVTVTDMAPEIKLLRLELLNGGSEKFRDYQPGQFAFVSAFGVGEDERYISTIDADGVALAAIQALYAENQALESRVISLEARLTALEARVNGGATSSATIPWALAVGGLFASGMVVTQRRHRGGAR